MNVILIEKDGNIYEKNVKSLDKLYSICGYRSNKDFEKLYEWEFDTNIYELYGKKKGKKDNENNLIKYDRKLKKLKYEIENEDNDGWSKLHYKALYKKRIKQLKNSIN